MGEGEGGPFLPWHSWRRIDGTDIHCGGLPSRKAWTKRRYCFFFHLLQFPAARKPEVRHYTGKYPGAAHTRPVPHPGANPDVL